MCVVWCEKTALRKGGRNISSRYLPAIESVGTPHSARPKLGLEFLLEPGGGGFWSRYIQPATATSQLLTGLYYELGHGWGPGYGRRRKEGLSVRDWACPPYAPSALVSNVDISDDVERVFNT